MVSTFPGCLWCWLVAVFMAMAETKYDIVTSGYICVHLTMLLRWMFTLSLTMHSYHICTINKTESKVDQAFDRAHLTIILQISVFLSVCLSVILSEFRFPRKPFARWTSNSTNVLPWTRRCAVWFEFVRMWSTYRIKWLLSGVRYDNDIDGQSAVPPTVASSCD